MIKRNGCTLKFQPAGDLGWSDEKCEQVGLALLQLAEAGASSAEDILEAAKVKSSVLHGIIEWDTVTAARQWQLTQAGRIARSLLVEVTLPDGKTFISRAFQPIRLEIADSAPTNGDGGAAPRTRRHFLPITTVISRKDYIDQVIDSAHQQLIGWESRYNLYKRMAKFRSVFDGVSSEIAKVDKRRRVKA